ncbi:MAG: hypothetical protein JNJ57_06080 [Saprospiraceae bacterium]|nr:hypothetical protein [Saprospiraceae bacterium]
MVATLTFKDETLTGNLIQEMQVSVEAETLTLREIIMLRVAEEIKRLEDEKQHRFLTAFSDLTEQERLLNGEKRPTAKRHLPAGPDPEAYGYRALEAFKKNAFFVIVDDKQIDDLETPVHVSDKTNISFVKLTPLVGG